MQNRIQVLTKEELRKKEKDSQEEVIAKFRQIFTDIANSKISKKKIFYEISSSKVYNHQYQLYTKYGMLQGTEAGLKEIAEGIRQYFMDEDFIENGEPKIGG